MSDSEVLTSELLGVALQKLLEYLEYALDVLLVRVVEVCGNERHILVSLHSSAEIEYEYLLRGLIAFLVEYVYEQLEEVGLAAHRSAENGDVRLEKIDLEIRLHLHARDIVNSEITFNTVSLAHLTSPHSKPDRCRLLL